MKDFQPLLIALELLLLLNLLFDEVRYIFWSGQISYVHDICCCLVIALEFLMSCSIFSGPDGFSSTALVALELLLLLSLLLDELQYFF